MKWKDLCFCMQIGTPGKIGRYVKEEPIWEHDVILLDLLIRHIHELGNETSNSIFANIMRNLFVTNKKKYFKNHFSVKPFNASY